MATYVLVHGAWHGGWCWQRVAPLLRTAGHDVHTPTLTGLGERVHLASPEIGLEMHVTDIVMVLQYEDLRDVILVGHSYAGMVITGVVERAAERLRHVVYLDAFVPRDGDSMISLLVEAGVVRELSPDGFMPVIPGHFGVSDPSDIAWLESKYTPHPQQTMIDALPMSGPLESRGLPLTYIRGAGGPDSPASASFVKIAAQVSKDPAWRYIEMATGHDIMVTQPRELADILLAMA